MAPCQGYSPTRSTGCRDQQVAVFCATNRWRLWVRSWADLARRTRRPPCEGCSVASVPSWYPTRRCSCRALPDSSMNTSTCATRGRARRSASSSRRWPTGASASSPKSLSARSKPLLPVSGRRQDAFKSHIFSSAICLATSIDCYYSTTLFGSHYVMINIISAYLRPEEPSHGHTNGSGVDINLAAHRAERSRRSYRVLLPPGLDGRPAGCAADPRQGQGVPAILRKLPCRYTGRDPGSQPRDHRRKSSH